MKRLLLILLLPFLGFSQISYQYLKGETEKKVKDYEAVVRDNGGKFYSEDSYKNVNAFYMQSVGSEMMDSVKFMWFAEAASSKEENRYAELYDMSSLENHGTQTTENDQLYVFGDWIPSGHEAMKNPNGDSRYVSYPEIQFEAGEAWSVTVCLNWYGSSNDRTGLFENTTPNYFNYIDFKVSSINRFYLITGNTEPCDFDEIVSTNVIIGKNTTLTYIAESNLIKLYVNGEYSAQEQQTSSATIFKNLFYTVASGREFYGTVSAHIIRAQALTPAQVLSEANLLQSIYPEIHSIDIGEYTVSVSNLEQVVSSDGTVITDGNLQATWATNASAYWCYHTDTETGAIYGKLYNKQARDIIIANPPSGWHVATEAELTAIALNGGNALRVEGTDYWTTTGGKNSTGFSAIGGASRNADGTFNTIKNTATFWCADSDNVLLLNHNDNTASITATTSAQGHSVRLIKDY